MPFVATDPSTSGHPHSIAPLPPTEWGDLTRVLKQLPRPGDEPLNVFSTLARADAELFRRWLGFGGALLAGTLPGRLRELVILRTSYRFDGRYEWAQHLVLGEWEGITSDGSTALGGPDVDVVEWIPLDRAALHAVDETAEAGAVDDPTWGELASQLSESELIELVMLIAHYMMLASVLRSLRVQLEPAAETLVRGVAGGPTA